MNQSDPKKKADSKAQTKESETSQDASAFFCTRRPHVTRPPPLPNIRALSQLTSSGISQSDHAQSVFDLDPATLPGVLMVALARRGDVR